MKKDKEQQILTNEFVSPLESTFNSLLCFTSIFNICEKWAQLTEET